MSRKSTREAPICVDHDLPDVILFLVEIVEIAPRWAKLVLKVLLFNVVVPSMDGNKRLRVCLEDLNLTR